MASKRTVPRKTSRKRRKGKTKAELKKLLRKAQAEVERLLKADQTGTLNRISLQAGLDEIDETLDAMEPLESWDKN